MFAAPIVSRVATPGRVPTGHPGPADGPAVVRAGEPEVPWGRDRFVPVRPDVPRDDLRPCCRGSDAGHREIVAGDHQDPTKRRPKSVPLARIAGIDVTLDWSLVLIFALLTWSLAVSALPALVPDSSTGARWAAAAATTIVFLASLLAHELSHSLTARRYGIGVRDIRLWLLGGISTLEGEAPTPRADFHIAIIGPATSAVLAVVFIAVAGVGHLLGAPGLLVAASVWLGSINGVLAVFNLLPGAPLDGGRVLRAALWKHRGDRRSAAISAARAGRTVGWVLVGLGLLEFVAGADVGGLWVILIGWFLTNAAHAEELQTVITYDLQGLRVRDVMTERPVCAPMSITVQQLLDEYIFKYRHSTFPLTDAQGRVHALATLAQLKDVIPLRRAVTAASSVAWPVEQVQRAAPDEPLLEVMSRTGRAGDGRVLVFEHEHLVGIVSPTDIARALQIAEAHPPSTARRAA
jgi:Zn-dependent protease